LRKRADDFVQLLCRKGERSAFRNRCGTLAAKSDLEVGGEKSNLVAFRFHQHIGQDGNRVLAFHDSLKKLQFSQKVVLSDDKFHGCADLEKGGGLTRDPLKKRRDSRIGNYTGKEGVLKSGMPLL